MKAKLDAHISTSGLLGLDCELGVVFRTLRSSSANSPNRNRASKDSLMGQGITSDLHYKATVRKIRLTDLIQCLIYETHVMTSPASRNALMPALSTCEQANRLVHATGTLPLI